MPVPRPRRIGHGTAYAGFEFEELVRSILHRGKYGGDRGALRAMAALTSSRLGAPDASWFGPVDLRIVAAGADHGEPRQADARISAEFIHGGTPRQPPPPPDAVVAVPLGPRRRRQRGYNQSDVVARVLADLQTAPILNGLQRIRETTPQSATDEQGRRRNVAGAFAWKGASLSEARLWLVDDVLTTGFTVEAAGEALSGAGASRVDVVIVAVVP